MSEPVISDEDVAAALVSMVRDGLRPHDQEILIYGSKQQGVPPGVLKRALAAFLKGRVPPRRFPDDGNGDEHNAGFNACRDIVWNGPTVSGFKTVVDSTIPPDEARLVVNGKVVGTVRGLK